MTQTAINSHRHHHVVPQTLFSYETNQSPTMIHDVRLSSVVPASITGENRPHRLSNTDLVMKHHYIKGVYLYDAEAARGLTTFDMKRPMFVCLNILNPVAGRIRVSEDGRPYIKCTDSGVRIVEAKCGESLEEWLELNGGSGYDQLAYDYVLGPDLGFTPLVFVQFTWFKCGGLSVGLSWSHILGDAFAASHFIHTWAQIISGQLPPPTTPTADDGKTENIDVPSSALINKPPSSLQKVQPGPTTEWLITNRCKMATHSFHVAPKQLDAMAQEAKFTKKPFEVISAIIWKSMAKVRGELPKNVTLCTRKAESPAAGNSGMTVWTVEAAAADLSGLAKLIAEEKVDETGRVMDVDAGAHGFILYGANLTFVNLEGLEIYGLELQGRKPVFGSFGLSGVGDNGAVLVLPGKEGGEKGRVVNVILAGDELEGLKMEMKNEWHVL